MNHVLYLIAFVVFANIFQLIYGENDNTDESIKINDISDTLIATLGVNANNSTRLKELKEKLAKVNSYAIDREKYTLLLKNLTTETNLNETSFYKSLKDDDDFKIFREKETKSLYLQLKEKMNRDDIITILSERGDKKYIADSARKMMGPDYFGGAKEDDLIDDLVDKILAEKPTDDHRYSASVNDSHYWDPQAELEELKEHHSPDGRRIFRGERTTIKHYPFVVSIRVMGRFWCGGSLYWKDLVITTAACLQLMHNNRFYRENPRILEVRVGSNYSIQSGEVIGALEVFFHPGYNPKTLKNNIALIRLQRQLNFNYHRVPKLIAISTGTHPPAATSEVLLLGWGVSKPSQKINYEPSYLQKKFLPVYPNVFCKEVYGDKFINDKMFCAGTFTTGEGACNHDAGGPAVLGGKLVGIISFGPSICGYPNAPTVFTLVGAYAKWIKKINDTMPSYYRGRQRTTTTTRNPIFNYLQSMHLTKQEDSMTTGGLALLVVRTPPRPPDQISPTPSPVGLRSWKTESSESYDDMK